MFDLVVIGGGLLGTGIARDAALRGLSVCLFEQSDFGAGAAARGSRLVTGGLNALETLDFTRVRDDIQEREILLQTAPHLVVPQPCLIPFYSHTLLTQARLRASLALADALGFDQSLPAHQLLSAAEARARQPALRPEGLTGAALVWEAAVPRIERLALETALDARRHGAVLRAHTRVESLRREAGRHGGERVGGVGWTDLLSGERGQTAARLVVAAAGAGWHTPGQSQGAPALAKLVSAVGPPLPGAGEALAFPREDLGALLFALPRPGGVWLGSLETEWSGDPETAHVTGSEADALVRQVREYLPEIHTDAISLAQASVVERLPPLAFSFGVPAPAYSIREEVGDGKVLTVSGGRASATRGIAEEVVDLACRKLGRALSTPPCRTASTPLPLPIHSSDGGALTPETLPLAVEWAVAEEECRTLRDFLLRRASLLWAADQGRSLAPAALDAIAARLGWDEERRARERKDYEAEVALTQAFRVV